MQNAVIYARFSSANQQEQSITGQLRDCRAYAEKNGFTVIQEYVDEALSARSDRRPSFQRMIQDSKQKQFDTVLVWKLDRFSRNRYDAAHYRHILKQNGVKVISVMEPISNDPEGIILESLLEGMAEYYSANLSVNVRRGIRESVLQQNFTGGMVPFGYVVENKKLKPMPELIPVITEIYERYRDGQGKAEIVKWLATRGVKTNYGRPVTVTSLEHIMSNRKYVGQVDVGDLSYQDESLRIMTDDLFNAVQDRLHRNFRRGAKKKAHVDYLLSGKCFCGHCGAPMVGESGKSRTGEIHNYYSCARRKKKHSCQKRNEPKLILEKYVVRQTVMYFLNPTRLSRTADALLEAFDRTFNTTEITNLEKRICKLEDDATATVDLIVAAAGTPSLQKRYEAKLIQLDEQKASLEDELARLRLAVGIRLTHEEVMERLRGMCEGSVDDPEFRKRIIYTFVNSVFVFDDRCTIFYNIGTSQNHVTYTGTLSAMKSSDSNVLPPPDRYLKKVPVFLCFDTKTAMFCSEK